LEEGLNCGKHGIKVVVPIRIFCKEFVDAEPEGEDWLDRELDRGELEAGQMYVWLGDDMAGFRYVWFVSVEEFGEWTYERFMEEYGKFGAE
jgi:hypothetical protein